MATVLKWNGKDLADELRKLPEGRYVIESVDAVPALTLENRSRGWKKHSRRSTVARGLISRTFVPTSTPSFAVEDPILPSRA